MELTVVVPTYNEIDNVSLLVERLAAALSEIEWEVIFVDDDSPDGTALRVRQLAAENPRVRCLQRIGRRGLSTAVIEGMLASSARYLAVIDADLQHDETLLPQMLAALKTEDLDIVIGSRYVAGATIGNWGKTRASISTAGTYLAKFVVPAPLADPLSGFFMLRRGALEATVHRLSGQGFKILLDLFASTPTPYRFRELPYVFRDRLHGQSKLDSAVASEYLLFFVDKLVGRWIPIRFVSFATIGMSGVFVHLLVLRVALIYLSFSFSQSIATFCAMTSNFILNNTLTYRDQRLRGWKLVLGLLSFYAICGVGAVANVGIASAAFREHYSWWLSGIAGAIVGVVWNYAVTSIFTWRSRS